MNIRIEPGRYVAAVSGGVDSVALLHMLKAQPDVKLIVAHYDHGIRPESSEDRKFVQQLARKHGLPFVYDTGGLGPGASEARAREARYKFLHNTREATGAKAVITAHHEDDMLETAIINLTRGTGRKGLSSLKSSDVVLRPLLHLSKADLLMYAHHHKLKWREDITNQDTRYLRNKIRHQMVAGLPSDARQQLRQIIDNLRDLNDDIDALITNQLHLQPALNVLDRHWFIMLPHSIAREVLAAWLRRAGLGGFDRKLLEKLVAGAKTLAGGSRMSVASGKYVNIGKDSLSLN